MRKTALLALALLMTLSAARALACVGKTLQVGVVPSVEEKLLTRMLSILVNERTGTSVKIREFGSFADCFTALEKNDIDLVIAFTGQGIAEVLSRRSARSRSEALEEARQVFNQKFNLVWLEPWGPTDGGRFLKDEAGVPLPTQAAPLVRKDTLKEFPALARLINKMAGRPDSQVMSSLLGKAEAGDADRVARDYLKAEKLI